jgi:hypothetical protein
MPGLYSLTGPTSRQPHDPAASESFVDQSMKLGAHDTVVLIEIIICMMSDQQSNTLEEARDRMAELYLNGTCLVRSILSGSFRKVPFFLRHLWWALAK